MKLPAWLVPVRKLTIDTALTPREICDRLSADVSQPTGWFGLGPAPGFFHGDVSTTEFELVRNITYRNSFLPAVRGVIEPTEFGSRVAVTMQPVGYVLAFMAFWLGSVALGCIVMLAMFIGAMGSFNVAGLIPFIMLAFGLTLMNVSFGGEAKKAAAYLHDALPAHDETEG
jgi:hypothetical protein